MQSELYFRLRDEDWLLNIKIEADNKSPVWAENVEANSQSLTPTDFQSLKLSQQLASPQAEEPMRKMMSPSTRERSIISGEVQHATDVSATAFGSEHERGAHEAAGAKLMSFDSSADFDFNFGFLPKINYSDKFNNSSIAERNSAPPQLLTSMEGESQARLPTASARVKPLHVRKASSQIHSVPSQQALRNNNSQQKIRETPVYPPRTSSIRNHTSYCNPSTSYPHATRAKTPSIPANIGDSSIATNNQGQYHPYTPTDHLSTVVDSDPMTISSNKSNYVSETDSSSAIMGDFVPIDSPNMAGLRPHLGQNNFIPLQRPKANPYEFEPPSPYDNPTRQTTLTDFIEKGQEAPLTLTPRAVHVKNSRSEGNVKYMAQPPNHLAVTPTKPNGHGLYRSESSPNVLQVPFSQRRDATQSPDILRYYLEAGENGSPSPHGRQDTQESTPRATQNIGTRYDSKSPRRRHQDYAQAPSSRSPTQQLPQEPRSYAPNRTMTRSPTKTLDDVSEIDEYDECLQNRSSKTPPHSPTKKRSRSPMKKMFGENGWLGQSPDEKPEVKHRPKKSFVTHTDFAHRPKKIGMMEKLKNKFEEIAEKADLNTMGRSRSNSDKQKQTVLSISIGPPEQARIYMELELMLVHTANNFLMSQFSQGRMDVDSIKKTVDLWKNKGRPVVLEFMYDQATQRDLVVANLQNFRFHGEMAGSDLRINSMLYNWKHVGNQMLIRTFCNADTVILKLLFDIEQILELLGAVEAMLIRLQQIRATATELMRIARLSKDSKASSQASFSGREPPRTSESSASSTLYSIGDPYGGLKLVPDNYKE